MNFFKNLFTIEVIKSFSFERAQFFDFSSYDSITVIKLRILEALHWKAVAIFVSQF